MHDSCILPDRCAAPEMLAGDGHVSLLRARDTINDLDMALKVIHAPAWMTPAEGHDFLARTEAALVPLTGLSHRGLATLFWQERTADSLIVAREFVPGRPLSHLLDSQWTLGPFEARRIAEEIGSALDAITRCGLVHQALTPENVIMRESGEFVLTDASIRSLANHFSVAGTACCLRSRTEHGDDIHALATIVFQALTGAKPEQANHALFAELPRGMREPIRRALNRDHGAYRSASHFARALTPVPTSAVFRHVWRPAAAAGLLASLATVGGNAVSEARRSARHQKRHHPATTVPIAAPLPSVIDTLAPIDASALKSAVRRQGPALLTHPAVAQLLDVSQNQTQQIEACLADHRTRVGRIVETAASGNQIDSATAMAELKIETNTRILNTLNTTQRARWEQIERDSAPAGELSL
jgi:tRNA A-37 threonylcarbamoyl transferase component Bud32